MSRRKQNVPSEPRGPRRPAAPPAKAPPIKLVAAVLAIITLGLFAPAAGFDFVNYDDPMFVTSNAHLPKGFTGENLAWAFHNTDAYLWHPVTWLTLLLDFKLHGLKAGGYHITNLLFHAGSTVLLFLTLRRMTGALWRSAAVAALFAWHPVHVQSVAWIAERKDVASCFFWMLTLWCYGRYAEKPGWWRYLPVAGAFALGLMSKPMVVTLPCVLLLLDVWPLRRVILAGGPADQPSPVPWAAIVKLVLEKVPLFVLAAAASWVTVKVMNTAGVLTTTERLSIGQRLANAVISYVRYVLDIFWPTKLAVFYPMPPAYPLWAVAGASLLLLAATVVAVREIHRRGFLAAGWFWFLGTMVPTIGLIQNGGQAMADRYTYIPYVGTFIALVWGLAALVEWKPQLKEAMRYATVAGLLACVVLTHFELKHWRNSITLFTHAAESTKDNYVAHYNLAIALDTIGKPAEAVEHYREAMRISPDQVEGAQNLAVLLYGLGKVDEAISIYEGILKRKPDYPQALVGMGAALDGRGDFTMAMEYYQKALRANPKHVAAYVGLGMSIASQGRPAEAVGYYRQALQYSPGLPDAEIGLAGALLDSGNPTEAIEHFAAGIQKMPGSDGAYTGYGIALARLGRLAESEAMLNRALQINDNPVTHNNLANVLVGRGKLKEAIEHYHVAINGNPNWVAPVNSLARLYSMGSDPSFRDGAKAVGLAERACQMTKFEQPLFLETLAAAYAENKQYDQAVAVGQKGLSIMLAMGAKDQAAFLQQCLELYKNKQPYHVKAP